VQETSAPTEKHFPKLRKTPRRQKSISRNFGKLRADGKVLPETSENSAPTEKYFPKLRKTLRRQKSTSRSFEKLYVAEEYEKEKDDKREIKHPGSGRMTNQRIQNFLKLSLKQ